MAQNTPQKEKFPIKFTTEGAQELKLRTQEVKSPPPQKLKLRTVTTEGTTKRKSLPVRISPELVERIDALKDPLIPREAFVRKLLEQAITAEERKARRGKR